MLLVYETKVADFQNKNSAIKNDRVLIYFTISVGLVFE